MEDGKQKNFKLIDCVLAVVCVVLTVEAAAPVAAIGNSQFFWWIFMLIFFCLPYSLISAELGTTYENEGGLSTWITRAFGKGAGSRVALYYWINFPLWTASIAVLVTDNIPMIYGVELGLVAQLIIRLLFIWGLFAFSLINVSENKWLFNLSTVFKAIIFLLLGAGGIYVAINIGAVNPLTVESMVPTFDTQSLSYISVIIFNFMGFEVITTYVNDMPNPKKDIPRAVIVGGICVTALYLLAAFGIGVAIPVDKISPSMGIIDAMNLLFPYAGTLFIMVIGTMLIVSMFANQLSWAFGIDYVARDCAINNGGMPEFFKKSSKKGLPVGVSFLNAIVATILVVSATVFKAEEVFWNFFALNLVMLLLSYVLLFPAFLKLRKMDKDIERPYKVHGNDVFIKIFAIVPMILLIISIFFTVVPFNQAEIAEKGLVLIGTIIVLIIVEIVVRYNMKKSGGL